MKPTERGRQFEKEMAAVLGADLVPGSGNQWFAKLDLQKLGTLMLSLKWTGKDGFVLTPKLFKEIYDAVYAPGGVGKDVIGGAVISVGDTPYAIFNLNDLVRILQEEITIGVQSKADAKVSRSRIPLIFRGEE